MADQKGSSRLEGYPGSWRGRAFSSEAATGRQCSRRRRHRPAKADHWASVGRKIIDQPTGPRRNRTRKERKRPLTSCSWKPKLRGDTFTDRIHSRNHWRFLQSKFQKLTTSAASAANDCTVPLCTNTQLLFVFAQPKSALQSMAYCQKS